ncbi:MAG: acylphosphatase [Pseudomonadota bacterium]
MSETVRAHVIITGKVQGVWYRGSTQAAAQRIGGIGGWVRNLPGGDVEAVMEGARDRVEALIAWCHNGPPRARVDAVNVNWEPPSGAYRDFEVRYY